MSLDSLLTQCMGQMRQSAQNNPMATGMLDVIESGDARKGEEMADNICKSMGVSREEAISQARRYFGI